MNNITRSALQLFVLSLVFSCTVLSAEHQFEFEFDILDQITQRDHFSATQSNCEAPGGTYRYSTEAKLQAAIEVERGVGFSAGITVPIKLIRVNVGGELNKKYSNELQVVRNELNSVSQSYPKWARSKITFELEEVWTRGVIRVKERGVVQDSFMFTTLTGVRLINSDIAVLERCPPRQLVEVNQHVTLGNFEPAAGDCEMDTDKGDNVRMDLNARLYTASNGLRVDISVSAYEGRGTSEGDTKMTASNSFPLAQIPSNWILKDLRYYFDDRISVSDSVNFIEQVVHVGVMRGMNSLPNDVYMRYIDGSIINILNFQFDQAGGNWKQLWSGGP